MKKYKCVIWDMDGTLLNTLEDLSDSTNASLQAFNLPTITIDDTRHYVGNGIRKLIERAVPSGTSAELTDKVFDFFREYYANHCEIKTKPYEGVTDLLEKLHNEGYTEAIVSNKIDSAVKELSEKYFSNVISIAVGEKEGIRKKPEPDAVYSVLNEFNIEKKDAIYIGDSEVDIQTAQNSGLSCISVAWGFRSTEELIQNGATNIVKNCDELYSLLSQS